MKQLQLTMPSSVLRCCCCVGVALLLLAPPPAASFSRGATRASCQQMVPGHIRAHPQQPQHSYVTVRTSASSYRPGQLVAVTVRSSRDFMGFLLQARSGDGVGGGARGGPGAGQVGGTWALTPPGVHTLHCGAEGDAVTHSDKQLKRNLSFVWRAPDAPAGDVRFHITVVQSYFVYWANIEAAVLHDGSWSSWSLMGGALMSPAPHQGGVLLPELPGRSSSPAGPSRNQTVPLTPSDQNLQDLVQELHRLVLPPGTGPTRLQSGPTPPTEDGLNASAALSSGVPPADEAPPPGGRSAAPPLTGGGRGRASAAPRPSVRSTSGRPSSASTESQSEAATAPRPLPSAPPSSPPPPPPPVPPSRTSLPSSAPPSPVSSSSSSMTPPLPPPPPGPSPAPRRSPDVPATSSSSPAASRESTASQRLVDQHGSRPDPDLLPATPRPVVHPNPRPHPNLHPHPDSRPPAPVRPVRPGPPGPDGEGGRPEAVPRRSAWELGMLLGCSAGLGVVLVAALRRLHRHACGRRTAVTLSDRGAESGRGERGLIHVQECGDLVRVRRIRENSLVLLAEYDVLAPPGD